MPSPTAAESAGDPDGLVARPGNRPAIGVHTASVLSECARRGAKATSVALEESPTRIYSRPEVDDRRR